MEAEDHIGSWTASQLADYVSGRMSSSECHRLERDMLEDPLLSEAVEGYEQLGQVPDMSRLNDRWKKESGTFKPGGNEILGPISLGLAVLVLIGGGAMFFQQDEISTLAEEVSKSIEETRIQEQVYADSLEVMEIKLARVVVSDKEIRPEETRSAQLAIKEQDEAGSPATTDPARVEPPSQIRPLGIPESERERVTDIEEPSPEVFYLHDLKLTDHRPEYDTELYIRGEWMSGTAARFEREQNGVTQVHSIEQVDYEGIMSDAMASFVARDYKSALLVLKRVEKRHPNDANVAFYGGLCYYNLSKWAKADKYFRRALDHSERVFDQEARWHLALSLIEQAKLERARYHLRIIIDENEFYANRARLIMREQ